jgi:hypothetical protein
VAWDDDADGEDACDQLLDLLDAAKPKEVVCKESTSFHDFRDHSDMDETAADFRRLFDDVVQSLTQSLGRPRFLGERGRSDFPSWSDALHLAIWAVEDDLAGYAAVHHPGRDAPFQLRVGVR